MTTLVTVYKTGGEYTLEYVERIASAYKGHMVCLSDDDSVSQYCEHIPLKHNLPGWWSKLEIFALPTGKYVYIDLDTIINKPLDLLMAHKSRFAMLSDFFSSQYPASGVMAWTGRYDFLLNNFNMSMAPQYNRSGAWGDQGYIAEQMRKRDIPIERLDAILPYGYITSRKAHPLHQREKAHVICYHGQPRPHTTGWAK